MDLKENQPDARPPITMYKIGKRNAQGRLEPAFVVVKRPEGAVSLMRMKVKLTDVERQALFAHFGRTYEIRWGGQTESGKDVQMLKKVAPGDQEHFEHAALTLPPPWSVMGSRQ